MPTVPVNPEPVSAMRGRYPAAVAEVTDMAAVMRGEQRRPGEKPVHVFDWVDGMRLIISRDLTPDGRIGIHLSASACEGSLLHTQIAERKMDPDQFTDLVLTYWSELSGEKNYAAELIGFSAGGVPHVIIWDPPAVGGIC